MLVACGAVIRLFGNCLLGYSFAGKWSGQAGREMRSRQQGRGLASECGDGVGGEGRGASVSRRAHSYRKRQSNRKTGKVSGRDEG